jgi:hypothetical protein
MPPKKATEPTSQLKVNILNLSDKMKILDLLKGGMSLVGAAQHFGKNKSSLCSMQHKDHE